MYELWIRDEDTSYFAGAFDEEEARGEFNYLKSLYPDDITGYYLNERNYAEYM